MLHRQLGEFSGQHESEHDDLANPLVSLARGELSGLACGYVDGDIPTMRSGQRVGAGQPTGETVTRQHWKWSVLAAMASYLDAGSIVALSSGLAFFQDYLGLSANGLGVLTALGPNAIGCAIGAFIGGRLGDKLGRKRIYKYDLLVYAAGIACVALAFNAPMLYVGIFVVGLSVGADVPTSLALVGEFSPAKARGKFLSLTQIAWGLGPVVVLLLAFALSSLELLGIRIVFGMLFLAALITWALRQGLAESARWREASSKAKRYPLSSLFRGPNLRALAWTGTIYLFTSLAAGTGGAFNPYIIKTLHAGGQAASVALSIAGYIPGLFAAMLLMRIVDRSHLTRKWLWGIGAILQVLSYGAYLVFPFTVPVVIANLLLFSLGSMLAGEAIYKIFSQELFPTMLRGTAQGFTFGLARTCLGIWSFFVPGLTTAGIVPLAALLTVFLLISGFVGFFFMPNTSGKSLEHIEAERAGG